MELDQLTPLPSAMPQLLPLLRGRGQESEAARRRSAARSGEPEKKEVPVPTQRLRSRRTGAFARLFDDQALGPVLRFPPRRRDACGEIRDGIRGGARPRFRPVFCPGESHPCPAGIPGRPAACFPWLNQTLAGLQTDVRQLAGVWSRCPTSWDASSNIWAAGERLKGGTGNEEYLENLPVRLAAPYRQRGGRGGGHHGPVPDPVPVCMVQHFSNWDPYGPDATSNIRVAVTSEDEGYELLGLKLNIGSMVLDGLKSNNQMGWDFVDSREEALEGVRSGRYYAALIVPQTSPGTSSAFWTRTCDTPRSSITKTRRKTPLPPRSPTRPKPPFRTRSTPPWWRR